MDTLHEWINPKYLDAKTVVRLGLQFKNATPFEHLVMPDFFKTRKIATLAKALLKEQFYVKESDLFKFMQTNDFISSKNRILKEFREFIHSEEFINYMTQLTASNIIPGKLDLHATLYSDTDFLLCHDDQLDSRRIAFLLYFSDLGNKDGGSLDLITMNDDSIHIRKHIFPKYNTFTFFKVSPVSFHAVSEIISKKHRVAIGGWFHDT